MNDSSNETPMSVCSSTRHTSKSHPSIDNDTHRHVNQQQQQLEQQVSMDSEYHGSYGGPSPHDSSPLPSTALLVSDHLEDSIYFKRTDAKDNHQHHYHQPPPPPHQQQLLRHHQLPSNNSSPSNSPANTLAPLHITSIPPPHQPPPTPPLRNIHDNKYGNNDDGNDSDSSDTSNMTFKNTNWYSRLHDLYKKHDKTTHQVEIPDSHIDKFNFKHLMKYVGPGFLISIAYLDPGNFLTDITAGVQFNYTLIWVLVASTILGSLLQILSAKLGISTGKHLAQMCRCEYGDNKVLLYTMWVLTEISIIASDIPEVIGAGFAFKMLFGLPIWAGVLITSVDTFFFLGLQYFGVRILETFVGLLVAVICVCFFIEAAISPIQWVHSDCPATQAAWCAKFNTTEGSPDCPSNYCGTFFAGFIPRVNAETIGTIVALIGATVMPHNLYLHSGLVQSRKIEFSNAVARKWAKRYNIIDVSFSLFVSCLINISIVIVAGSVFYPGPQNNYQRPSKNPEDIGYMDAQALLQDTLHGAAGIIFAIALLASGQSSTITGTYAGQFVMDGFLGLKLPLWKRNLLTRSAAIVPSLVISCLSGENGSQTLIIASSALLAFQLPFALVPLLKFTSSRKIMGTDENSKLMSILCWALSFLVVLAGVYEGFATVSNAIEDYSLALRVVIFLCAALLALLYFGLLGYLIWRPVKANNDISLLDKNSISTNFNSSSHTSINLPNTATSSSANSINADRIKSDFT